MAEFKTDTERDRERAVYYMSLAAAVRNNANCWVVRSVRYSCATTGHQHWLQRNAIQILNCRRAAACGARSATA